MSTDDQQKRGGLVPIGKVAVRLPGIAGARACYVRTGAPVFHAAETGQPVDRGSGGGAGNRLHGAAPGPVFSAAHESTGSASVRPAQRAVHARHDRRGGENRLPFGNLPRLLLAWVCSEAVRTQSRDLVLGRSLYEFMHKLGMEDRSGGRHGERARLKNQMDRLFTSSAQLVYAADDHKVVVSSFVAERAEFWWNTKRPEAPSLWESKIELGERFFQEIIAHPIPARHAHSARPQAVAARVGFVFLARVQNLRAAPAAYALLASALSTVRRKPGARRAGVHQQFSAVGPARV